MIISTETLNFVLSSASNKDIPIQYVMVMSRPQAQSLARAVLGYFSIGPFPPSGLAWLPVWFILTMEKTIFLPLG